MKKILVIIALVFTFTFVDAQNISFIFNDSAIANGDTVTVLLTSQQIASQSYNVPFKVHNNTSEDFMQNNSTGHRLKCVTVSDNPTAVIAAMCADVCVTGNVSGSYNLSANSTTGFNYTVDLEFPAGVTSFTDYLKLSSGTNASNYDNDGYIYLKVTTGSTEGIADAEKAAKLNAYPNPATSQVSINYNLVRNGRLSVYNMLGNEVYSLDLSAGEGTAQINVSSLPKGVYVYGIQGSAMKRLVIK